MKPYGMLRVCHVEWSDGLLSRDSLALPPSRLPPHSLQQMQAKKSDPSLVHLLKGLYGLATMTLPCIISKPLELDTPGTK